MEELWEGAAAAGAPTARLAQTEDASDVKEMEDVDMDSAPLPLAPRSTVKFPTTLVPMENKFIGDRYYVRECYQEYYGLVMDMLGERSGVTVTGTPGIGKSVFMAYFFECYSTQYLDATIEMKSYDQGSILRQVVTTLGKTKIKESRRRDDVMEVVYQSTEAAHMEAIANPTADSLWLLDGPPTIIPIEVKWVSFTSPNEKWLAKVRKSHAAYYKVYMPTWTQDELHHAARRLRLHNLLQATSEAQLGLFRIHPMTEPTPRRLLVDVCFDVFGGVPRFFFQGGNDDLGAAYTSLSNAIDGLTLDQIWEAMTEEKPKKQVHRVLHYAPHKHPHVKAELYPGSVTIERLIVKREAAIIRDNQDALERMLDGVHEGQSFLRYLFEARTQRLLVNGCTVYTRNLSGDTNKSLEITISDECKVGRVTNTFDIELFDRDDPLVTLPAKRNLASVDSFYWQPEENNGRVVLFQVTVSQHHPVKAHGLYQALKKLQLWESYQACPDDTVAALVFVVPSARAGKDKFKKQRIEIVAPLKDSSSVKDIDGIGQAKATRLAPYNIGTVGELRNFQYIVGTGGSRALAKVDKELIHEAQMMLKKHQLCDEMLAQIPQYVWGI